MALWIFQEVRHSWTSALAIRGVIWVTDDHSEYSSCHIMSGFCDIMKLFTYTFSSCRVLSNLMQSVSKNTEECGGE